MLYLDDDESYDYEKGAYSEIVFNYFEKNRTLQLKKGVDNYIIFKDLPVRYLVTTVGNEKVEEIFFKGDNVQVNF